MYNAYLDNIWAGASSEDSVQPVHQTKSKQDLSIGLMKAWTFDYPQIAKQWLLSFRIRAGLFELLHSSHYDSVADPRSLVDKKIDSESIRFLTAVVRASLGSHVGKPSSAYGWSGGFSPGSPVFAHMWWTIGSI